MFRIALLAAAAAVAPLAAAQDSIASCRITSSGLGGSMSEQVATEIVETASLYLCGNDTSAEQTANIVADEIVTATAFAIVSASADCFASASSRIRINGRTAVGVEAVAIASAVVDLAAEVEVCGECSAAAALWAASYEEILISASAEAEFALNGSTTPGETLDFRISQFRAEFVSATADATADILLSLRGAVDEGCNATILADIGSDLNGLNCNVSAVGTADNISVTATAAASSAARAVSLKPCGIEVETNVTTVVIQVAQAVAIAIADVRASCLIAGDAYVCALAEAEISAVANATAFAFASAYRAETELDACSGTVCELEIQTLVSVIQTVIVRATSALYLQQCAGGDTFFDIRIFQETLVSVILAPFIEIVDSIQVINGKCSVRVPVFEVPGVNDTSPGANATAPEPAMSPAPAPAPGAGSAETLPVCNGTCAQDEKECFNASEDTAPRACCSPDHVCIRRDNMLSQCRKNGEPGTFVEWDGREDLCLMRT